MARKFIIIHTSDIFRKGLHAVVEELYFSDPVCMSSANLLSDDHISTRDEVILFIKPEIFYREKPIIEQKIISIAHTKLIAASIVDAELYKFDFDELITINDDTETIYTKLEKIITTSKVKPKVSEETLSEREKDVLKEVALGYANKEIADRLFISIHTVISHRKNITEKLGIKSISGLTVYAILNKIIDTSTINASDLI
jgi:DNA-binding CsgD family transcriptional regulator